MNLQSIERILNLNNETKVIAEFCQNHNGDFKTLERMIEEASLGGARYGKIQMLYSNELTRRPEFEVGGNGPFVRPYNDEFARLSKLDLNTELEFKFRKLCYEVNMIPMVTVFSHKAAKRAFEGGFKAIKIASCDSTSFPLIKTISEFAEEIVISTGGTKWTEIQELAEFLSYHKIKKVTILHCRTFYPLELDSCQLWRMLSLRTLFTSIGWSDHTPQETGVSAAKCAAFLGANIIELHFTVLKPNETKDGPVSRNKQHLQELTRFIEKNSSMQIEELNMEKIPLAQIIGNESDVPSITEIQNRSYYRGRVASINSSNKQIYNWEKWVN